MNKRLLVVLQFFPNPRGQGNTGGTISNLAMLRTLAKKYTITVLSFDRTSNASDFVDEPFKVIFRPPPLWHAPGLILYWLDFVRQQVINFFKNEFLPDVVIASTSTLVAFEVCPNNIRKIAIVRAYENFGAKCPWVPIRQKINLFKIAAVRRFKDVSFMRKADAILTNSDFMKEAVTSRFAIKCENIYVLKQSTDVVPSTIDPPNCSVGFVTRGPDKGLSLVLKIARQSPDISYHIYGHSGDFPPTLPENVIWEGWASDRKVMFSSVALWIVPSLWAEPFGRVSIEAQSADRPVLVADTGGLPETVLDSRFKIEGFKPEQWVKRIQELLEMPTADLRQNGEKIRMDFSLQEHDRRLFDAIDSILGIA